MRVGILISGLLFAGACGGSDSSSTPPVSHNKTVDVFALSTIFSPNLSNIVRGDTVRFNIVPSQNGEGHNVIFNATTGAPANILVVTTGVFTRVFNTTGTFHYECTIHPGMNGDVVVQ
jgi:plastocyanin